jgi:hypothetical protein
MTDDSGLLIYQLAAGEDSEVRNSANVESGGELLVLIGIHLQNDSATRHISRGARNLRSGCVTGATPFGPEIDKYRNLGTANNLVEQRLIHLERLVDRR